MLLLCGPTCDSCLKTFFLLLSLNPRRSPSSLPLLPFCAQLPTSSLILTPLLTYIFCSFLSLPAVCAQLPTDIQNKVNEQYQRDVARMHGGSATAADDEYKAFLAELGGGPPPEAMGGGAMGGAPGGGGGGGGYTPGGEAAALFSLFSPGFLLSLRGCWERQTTSAGGKGACGPLRYHPLLF